MNWEKIRFWAWLHYKQEFIIDVFAPTIHPVLVQQAKIEYQIITEK